MAGTARQARRMAPEFSFGRDAAAVRQRIEAAERLFEHLFVVPGIRRPVGLDAIVGLVPVAGDMIGALMGLYIVWEARNLALPKWRLAHMVGRVGLDAVLGSLPLVGDLFDFLYRSNSRNLKTIRKHLDKHHPATRVVEG
jgi:hypothetical protein